MGKKKKVGKEDGIVHSWSLKKRREKRAKKNVGGPANSKERIKATTTRSPLGGLLCRRRAKKSFGGFREEYITATYWTPQERDRREGRRPIDRRDPSGTKSISFGGREHRQEGSTLQKSDRARGPLNREVQRRRNRIRRGGDLGRGKGKGKKTQ